MHLLIRHQDNHPAAQPKRSLLSETLYLLWCVVLSVVVFGLAVVGTLAVVFWVSGLKHARPVHQAPSPAQIVAPPVHRAPSPAQIVAPHLRRANQRTLAAIDEHIRTIDDFFARMTPHTRGFVEEALSWSSKWRFIADKIPFTDGDRHKKFLEMQLKTHYRMDQLPRVVEQVVEVVMADTRSIENKMLVDLRRDVANFPHTYPLARTDDTALHNLYNEALAEASSQVGVQVGFDVSRNVVDLIVFDALRATIARLGVSTGILGSGMAASVETLGLALVGSIIVNELVSWIWDLVDNPKGKLEAALNAELDTMRQMVVEGRPGQPGLRARLRQWAQERAVARRAALLSMLQPVQGGTL